MSLYTGTRRKLRALGEIVKGRAEFQIRSGAEYSWRQISMPGHDYYFGYNDITGRQIYRSGYLLLHRGRSKNAATLTLVNQSGLIHDITDTVATNYQIGSRALFLNDESIAYNDIIAGRAVSRKYDLLNKKIYETGLPAFYAYHNESQRYLCIDFGSLYHHRKSYGYPVQPNQRTLKVDIYHRTAELICSIDLCDPIYNLRLYEAGEFYLNHPSFSPSGDRILINLVRQNGRVRGVKTFVIKVDTRELLYQSGETSLSHYCWIDEETIIASIYDDKNYQMKVINVSSGVAEVSPISRLLGRQDFHISFEPNAKKYALDGYPNIMGTSKILFFDGTLKLKSSFDILTPSVYSLDEKVDHHTLFIDCNNCLFQYFDGRHRQVGLLHVR